MMMGILREIARLLTVLLSIVVLSSTAASSVQIAAAQPSSEGQSRIAFVTADYDTREMTISLVDPDSGAVTTLVNEGNFFFPMLSPDGQHLAFLGEHPTTKRRNIYVINTDGSDLRPLMEVDTRAPLKPDGQVAWSANSEEILYGVRDRNGKPASFFRVNLDGDDPVEIEFPDITESFFDTWITSSPDGSRLAVLVQNLDQPYQDIFVADADGSNAQPITSLMENGQAVDRLTWSPDNLHTLLNVVMGNAPEPLSLMIADGDGADAESLISSPPNYINSVSWSPDGSQIAFLATEMSSDAVPDGEVYVADADGYAVRALNTPINVAYVGTSWAFIPDEIVLPDTPTSFTGALE